MQTSDAMTRRPWRMRLAGGALVLLGLALAGQPEGRAQYWAFRKVIPTRERDHAAPQPSFPTTPSYFPDGDSAYPSYSPATTSLIRSSDAGRNSSLSRSYYFGGESAQPLSSSAGESSFEISAAALPWNQRGFTGYDEPPVMPQNSSVFPPRKYALKVTPLPAGTPVGRPETALLIAGLPENALLWVEGQLTRLRGPVRYFQSPPLIPGERYSYQLRAVWVEDGRWVSQTLKVPVQAGKAQALFLRPG
jgi:uncharacterized protein (TIGR03000 family)